MLCCLSLTAALFSHATHAMTLVESPFQAPDIASSIGDFKTSRKPPRLWPAVAIVVLYWAAWLAVTALHVNPFVQFLTTFWAPQIAAVLAAVWWLFFCRLPWLDRLYGLSCLALVGLAAFGLCHKTM